MEDATLKCPSSINYLFYALAFVKSFDEQHMLAHMLAPSFSAPLMTW